VNGDQETIHANKDNVAVGKINVFEMNVNKLRNNVSGLVIKLQQTSNKNVTGNLMVKKEEDKNVVNMLLYVKEKERRIKRVAKKHPHVTGKEKLLSERSLRNVRRFLLVNTVRLHNVVNS